MTGIESASTIPPTITYIALAQPDMYLSVIPFAIAPAPKNRKAIESNTVVLTNADIGNTITAIERPTAITPTINRRALCAPESPLPDAPTMIPSKPATSKAIERKTTTSDPAKPGTPMTRPASIRLIAPKTRSIMRTYFGALIASCLKRENPKYHFDIFKIYALCCIILYYLLLV